MNRNRPWQLIIAGGLLAFLAGCTERNAPTALRGHPAAAFDAAAPLTSVVTDPAGDAAWNRNTGPGSAAKVPGYLDIVRVEVSKMGRTFVFTMDLADVVPSSPAAVSGGLGVQGWLFGLDTDPTTFPSGQDGAFPSGPGQTRPFEFFVDVEWDGTEFTGLLYDLRPLLTGEAMVVTPAPFTIDGAEIRVSVDASALGEPSAFQWDADTCARHAHLGSDGFQCFDPAPDAGFATWPQ